MAIIPQQHLFTWKDIDAASDLDRLRLVLSVLPDEPLMRRLEKRRGNGRDDYPSRPTWNAVVAGIVFQHPSTASLLREMQRNAELRQVCGFDPLGGSAAAPSQDAMSRFFAVLMEEQDGLQDLFRALVDRLASVLPTLGEKIAVDAKAVPSFARPVQHGEKGEQEDRRRDTDADKGVKTYRGIRDDGTGWEKVKTWFGYKLHLLVDSVYELPLAFKVTEASAGDSPELMPLLETLEKNHRGLSARARELSADRAYDSRENKRRLFDEYSIRPLIDIRTCWKTPGETRPLVPDHLDFFVYDERGNLWCICPATGKRRPLVFHGFERDRNALKYRCPAAARGFACRGRQRCESRANVGPFGRTVRVPLDLDRRIFTPIPRPTPRWEKAYARRTAVERVNGRLDTVLGFEKHTIRGKRKMETRLTLALCLMLAMALGRIREQQKDRLRSFLAPVQSRAG